MELVTFFLILIALWSISEIIRKKFGASFKPLKEVIKDVIPDGNAIQQIIILDHKDDMQTALAFTVDNFYVVNYNGMGAKGVDIIYNCNKTDLKYNISSQGFFYIEPQLNLEINTNYTGPLQALKGRINNLI